MRLFTVDTLIFILCDEYKYAVNKLNEDKYSTMAKNNQVETVSQSEFEEQNLQYYRTTRKSN